MEKKHFANSEFKDTHPDIVALQRQQIMKKSGAERIKMAFSMFATAKQLVRANLQSRFPQMTEEQLRIEIFKRIYMNDFSPAIIEKIIQSMQRT